MKKAKLFIFLLLLALLTLTVACGSGSSEDNLTENIIEPVEYEIHTDLVAPIITITLDDVLAAANLRRQNIFEPDMNAINALVYGRTPSVIDWERLFYAPSVQHLSTEEAIEDVMILFDLLKHWYGAYNYFGGDDVFLPLRDNILDSLTDNETVLTRSFSRQIQTALSEVIADNHFVFSGAQLGVNYNRFVWETPFDKTENGFRHRETGRYLAAIDGHNIDETLRLAVNEHGEFFYAPILLRPANHGAIYTVRFTFENGDENDITMTNRDSRHQVNTAPSLDFTDGIPIVSLKGHFPYPVATAWDEIFGFDPADGQQFLSFAEELRGEDAIIIDIRSNPGGDPWLSRIWLYTLMGHSIPRQLVSIGPQDMTPPEDFESLPHHWYLYFNPLDETTEFYETWIEIFDPFVQIDDYHLMEFLQNTPGFSNDTLIILLVDRFSGSASEVFTSHVLSMENTLVIGQNTVGALLTSAFFNLHLPNSGIPVVAGPTFFVHPEGQWQEGIGYAPDVWVIGDTLTAAFAILNNR